MIEQVTFHLLPKSRGFHIVTSEILHHLPPLPQKGVLHLFIQHTSAGLTINENADPSVRVDFESIFNKLVPENESFYTHTYEGPDDMPAHVKASLIGFSLEIPISDYRLNLGTWQGVYLGEFRNQGGKRTVVATIIS